MKNNIRTEDDRYEAIRQATIGCIGKKDFNKNHHDTGNRWLDIAKVWDKIITCKEHFVLTSAIHKIMWGVHPCESGAAFGQLLALVEEELLRDGEAYQAWASWDVFKRVLADVMESSVSFWDCEVDVHFITHYHYLRNRALREIVYAKDSCSEPDMYADHCPEYEAVVALLVPASKQWSRQQWGNDCVLAEALENLYGMDFLETWESQRDYDRMVNLIRAWDRQTLTDVYWYATNIENLPDGIIQRIWPENTENILADILIKAYAALVDYEQAGTPFAYRKDEWIDPLYHFECSAFKHSWIYKYVIDRYYQDTYEGNVRDQIRKVIFDITVTGD